MKTISVVLLVILFCISAAAFQSLQSVYDQAGPEGRYDKHIVLNPAEQYLGDLSIPPGHNVYIEGGGAMIFGQAGIAAISVSGSNIDINHCLIVGGLNGIQITDNGSATISNNTFYGLAASGIRTAELDSNALTTIWDNIIVNCRYGIYILAEHIPHYIAFNTIYDMDSIRYAAFCPNCGGGTVSPFDPIPGLGDQDLDPLFADTAAGDFHLQADSPCRNSGRYSRDRGALPYTATSVEQVNTPATVLKLKSYPNPFNCATTIEFELPSETSLGLKIYDLLGRQVIGIGQTCYGAGRHTAAVDFRGLPSGLYICRLEAKEYTIQTRLILLR